jgi:hypothetical protein
LPDELLTDVPPAEAVAVTTGADDAAAVGADEVSVAGAVVTAVSAAGVAPDCVVVSVVVDPDVDWSVVFFVHPVNSSAAQRTAAPARWRDFIGYLVEKID